MLDIVRVFQALAESKAMTFLYGRKAVLNLIDTGNEFTGDLDAIYFLLEYRDIKPMKNQFKTGTKGVMYSGTFYLVKHSDLDQNFFNEVGTESESKYVTNIEPLLNCLNDFELYFGCGKIEYETMKAQDVTDFLDMNADGLMINFTAYIPNDYTG
jgi:hypothetical protein